MSSKMFACPTSGCCNGKNNISIRGLGAFSPLTSDSFLPETPRCNGGGFYLLMVLTSDAAPKLCRVLKDFVYTLSLPARLDLSDCSIRLSDSLRNDCHVSLFCFFGTLAHLALTTIINDVSAGQALLMPMHMHGLPSLATARASLYVVIHFVSPFTFSTVLSPPNPSMPSKTVIRLSMSNTGSSGI